MSGGHKKTGLLAVLLAVWAGTGIWLWLTKEEARRVPLTNVSGQQPAQPGWNGHGGDLHIQLDLLTSSRNQQDLSSVMPRNIFSLPETAEAAGPSPDAAPDLPQQQQMVLEELAQFHYLGFVRKEGGDRGATHDLAVLTKNDEVHVAGRGEILERHVVVKTITPDSVTLLDRASHLEYTVPLTEEAASEP